MSDQAKFKKTVWDYYKREGRKMPWRETRDAYRILVSEIMLQQTQVSRVMVKYAEFLKAFPSFRALAMAPVPDVLRVWQGLGYNRRALSLKKAAEIVTKEYKSKLPETVEELIALPGIGKGTAGSLSAFVFNKPVPFIETNIRRVYIHHFFPFHEQVKDDRILKIVEETVDRKNPREWYYALMDYGSMLGRMQKLENPNVRSAHYVKQSKFEGSNRALRGKVLKMILEKKNMSVRALEKNIATTKGVNGVSKLPNVLKSLEKEGFIKRKKSSISLG